MTALHDYETGAFLRRATAQETRDSILAARRDGGAGAIETVVRGRTVTAYVVGGEVAE